MMSTIQQSNFSHAKCSKCGYLAQVEKFEVKENPNIKLTTKLPEGVTLSFPVFICPLCNSDATEALFPNEVN